VSVKETVWEKASVISGWVGGGRVGGGGGGGGEAWEKFSKKGVSRKAVKFFMRQARIDCCTAFTLHTLVPSFFLTS
jgi:hypothetical protein